MPGTGSDGVVLLSLVCLSAIVVILVVLVLTRPRH